MHASVLSDAQRCVIAFDMKFPYAFFDCPPMKCLGIIKPLLYFQNPLEFSVSQYYSRFLSLSYYQGLLLVFCHKLREYRLLIGLVVPGFPPGVSLGVQSSPTFERIRGSHRTLRSRINPLTPKSDQLQISPAASPAILHHTV